MAFCFNHTGVNGDVTSNNDRESSGQSENPIVCFLCDPIYQIRKIFSLFGTLGHNYDWVGDTWNWEPLAQIGIHRIIFSFDP